MYSLTILLVSGLAALAIGLGMGLLLGRRASSERQRLREMEVKLDQVTQDRRAYEDEVVEHFSHTAKLLNSLTDSYRDVHNHLATGAASLCQGQGPIALDRFGERPDDAEIPSHLTEIHAPLDYAPKASPGEKGMLNEEFGLERNKLSPDAAKTSGPAKPKAH